MYVIKFSVLLLLNILDQDDPISVIDKSFGKTFGSGYKPGVV